jgi:hypothetical protein
MNGGRKDFHSAKPRRWGIRRGDGGWICSRNLSSVQNIQMSRIPIQQPSHSQLDFSDPDRDYPSPRVTPLHLSPAAPASLGHFYHDPRNSSQASLLPLEHGSEHRVHRHSRRTLLLVYIHGFMGNETSFQSFPAHLHNILTVTLGNDDSRDYLVHTKVYPKFKTRHAIKVVTGEFSAW